jgi:HD superfamily phosphohydrolase
MTSNAKTYPIELRDPIHGPVAVHPAELAVVDSAAFQRLRGVKQLGFADRVFPGAVHTRYLHGLGAMHLAGRAVEALSKTAPWLSDASWERLCRLVRLAALLHDLGHAPMSHAAEALLPSRRALNLEGWFGAQGRASHEDVTTKLLVESELTGIIDRSFDSWDVHAVDIAVVLRGQSGRLVIEGVDCLPLCHALVSGELDVDRMDYLLRDSYFTGVRYGLYDLDWLLSHLRVVRDGDSARLGIDMRAVPTFEHFLLARYHMFQMVYFHPKSDIYDTLLQRWLAGDPGAARLPADPEDFVRCDDAWLSDRLAHSNDPWARRVRDRCPPSLVLELRGPDARARAEAGAQALTAEGLTGICLEARPVLSRYAISPAHLRNEPLLVWDARGSIVPKISRIEEVTDLFDRYDRTLQVARVYTLPEELDRARALLAEASR